MKRRQYSDEEKLKIVKEALETGNSSIVAERHQVSANLVARWVKEYKEQTNPDISSNVLLRRQRKELPYNPDVYKKSLAEKVAIAEKWISREYRAMLVLRIVGISRSTYYYQLSRKGSERHTGGGRPVPDQRTHRRRRLRVRLSQAYGLST